MKNKSSQLFTGAQVAARACQDAGAEFMYGYPITPGTEILQHWIEAAQLDKNIKYLQTEDEIAAGFCVCGAVMAGKKAFTATAGPGTILMQDALSMAEGMRLPFVAIIAQRGGPSSGTVIYSQQEVNLAINGGNGEGQRIVFSPTGFAELYTLTRRAFNAAWKYRFPAIVLSDGFSLKTKQTFIFPDWREKNVKTKTLKQAVGQNVRNIYTFENELKEVIEKNQKDLDNLGSDVVMSEKYLTIDAKVIVTAHGLVAAAAKRAVDKLRSEGKKVGLFRAISLNPLDKKTLNEVCAGNKKLLVVESSLGQYKKIIKNNLKESVEIYDLFEPAVGIEAGQIISRVNELL